MNGVIYARYSSDRQTEQSIEGQLRECREYAEQNDIRIINTYIDRAKTGLNDKREDFQRMLRDSKNGSFGCVIVWKIDRFGRSREDIAKNKAILRRNGVSVLYAREHIPEGAEGIILEGLLESLAEYYSAELKEKITRGMRESAYKCQFNGSGLAIGYRIDEEHKYHLDERGAEVVQLIFDLYDGGKKIAEIRNHLCDKGIKTLRGKEFTHGGIARVLQNRQYLGEYRWRDILIPGGIPRIISDEQFERVQKEMAKNKKAPARARGGDCSFLLTGKIFCGKCKGNMVGDSGTSHTGDVLHYYVCANRKRKHSCDKRSVRKDWIERDVTQITVDSIFRGDIVSLISDRIVQIQQKERSEQSELKILHGQLNETEKSIKNILRAIEAGILTESTGNRLRELEASADEIRGKIEIEKSKYPVLTKEQVEFFIEQFRGGDVADKEYQRKIIDMFVHKVILYDDRLIITYNCGSPDSDTSISEIESAASGASGSDALLSAPPKIDKSRQRFVDFYLLPLHYSLFTKKYKCRFLESNK